MDSFLDAIYEQKRNHKNKYEHDSASIHEHYLIGPGYVQASGAVSYLKDIWEWKAKRRKGAGNVRINIGISCL